MGRKKPGYPGQAEGSGKPGPSARVKGSALFQHWHAEMRDAASTYTWPLGTVSYPVFVVGWRKLRATNKMTEEQAHALITEFARQVKTKQIDVTGKQPWFVFLGSWHKLGGSASTSGMWAANEELSDEEWT